jgi:hypothetical protein
LEPGIDLAARLAHALGVPVADLLPTTSDPDDLDVTRRQARKLFDELVGSEDRAVLIVLTQLPARLSKAGHARPRQPFHGVLPDRPTPSRDRTALRRLVGLVGHRYLPMKNMPAIKQTMPKALIGLMGTP